ncbi:MAG: AAA family ATPase, partial [Lentisphaerota bacterium]
MQNPVRINSLDVENVKRIQAVSLDCSGQALTVIGGGNAQGKTSLLDAIMWGLGGDRYRPSKALREGEEKLAIKIALSNGLTVERKGINGALKVTDSSGSKGGQQLLNEFVSHLALDLPRFMQISAKEKAQMLLDEFPGLGLQLEKLSQESKRLYDERHSLGQIAERKQKHADDLPFHPDVPEKPLTGSEMTTQMQAALQVNARNAETRRRRDELLRNRQQAETDLAKQDSRITEMETRLAEERHRRAEMADRVKELEALSQQANAAAGDLHDADTTEIQRALEELDSINAKVRQNMDKERAADEAREMGEQYRALSVAIEKVRAERVRLLAGIKMPLEQLFIDEDGELIYGSQ